MKLPPLRLGRSSSHRFDVPHLRMFRCSVLPDALFPGCCGWVDPSPPTRGELCPSLPPNWTLPPAAPRMAILVCSYVHHSVDGLRGTGFVALLRHGKALARPGFAQSQAKNQEFIDHPLVKDVAAVLSL